MHFDIAHEFLKTQTINSNDALQIFMHLHTAEDWDTLVGLLIKFMLGIKTPEYAKHFDWVQYFFSPDKEWPDDIPLGMRIVLRSLHLRIIIMAGKEGKKEYIAYDADLEQLISAVTNEDMLSLLFARMNAGALLEEASPELTARGAIEVARVSA